MGRNRAILTSFLLLVQLSQFLVWLVMHERNFPSPFCNTGRIMQPSMGSCNLIMRKVTLAYDILLLHFLTTFASLAVDDCLCQTHQICRFVHLWQFVGSWKVGQHESVCDGISSTVIPPACFYLFFFSCACVSDWVWLKFITVVQMLTCIPVWQYSFPLWPCTTNENDVWYCSSVCNSYLPWMCCSSTHLRSLG